jgi:septal ring factor EnvC (AmiA/AmiB activator)
MGSKFLTGVCAISGILCVTLMVLCVYGFVKYGELQDENKQTINALENSQNSLKTYSDQNTELKQENNRVTGALQDSQNSLKTCSDENVRLQQENDRITGSLESSKPSQT